MPERHAYQQWGRKMRDPEWLHDVRLGTEKQRAVRVTGNVGVGHGVSKAPGGRVSLVVASGGIIDALVSGDFYAIGNAPAELVKALIGAADGAALAGRLAAVWPEVEAPGLDWTDVAEAARQALGAVQAVPTLTTAN